MCKKVRGNNHCRAKGKAKAMKASLLLSHFYQIQDSNYVIEKKSDVCQIFKGCESWLLFVTLITLRF